MEQLDCGGEGGRRIEDGKHSRETVERANIKAGCLFGASIIYPDK